MKLTPKKMGAKWWMMGSEEPIGPYDSEREGIEDCQHLVDGEKEQKAIHRIIKQWTKRDMDKGALVELILKQCDVVKYDDVLDILFSVIGLVLVNQKQWGEQVSVHRVAARIVEAMENVR